MESPKLADLLDHENLGQVETAVVSLLTAWYDDEVIAPFRHVFKHVVVLFQGQKPGFRACNTDYHNLRHTIDVLVATVRLIDGFNFQSPLLRPELARDLCRAALLHDVGYIQETDDAEGTGAKYTKTHVGRGVAYTQRFADELKITAEAGVVGRLIWGTDLGLPWTEIGFSDETEELAAAILASADLLGQMADRTYLEKLLFLYYEFREAGFQDYETEFDMLRKTQGFYQVIQKRLDTTLKAVYNLASLHFSRRIGVRENLYVVSIERQKEYLRTIIDDTTTNFRRKLRRLDLERAESRLLA